MSLQLPYSGIGAPLPSRDDPTYVRELERRLEAIEGNFLELTGIVDKPLINRRVSIDSSESTSASTYTTLTTPDSVKNVWLAGPGLIHVAYAALWTKSSDASTADAAIFLNSDQLKVWSIASVGDPIDQKISTIGADTNTEFLMTQPRGLITSSVGSGDFGSYDLPQALGATDGSGTSYGGVCSIMADAGTYEVSIKFQVSTGTLSVKERRLWVWVMEGS